MKWQGIKNAGEPGGMNRTAKSGPLSPRSFACLCVVSEGSIAANDLGGEGRVRGNAVKDLSSCFERSSKSPFSPWQGGEGGRRPDEGVIRWI